jgi:hypothetical protein
MAIKCCKDCVPPTRYPGCHAKCSKYLEEKAKWEEEKQKIAKNKVPVLTSYDFDKIAYSSCKRHKRRFR